MLTGLLLFFICLPLSAQKPVDFVVLLDNSESMFRQSGNRVELVVTEIMKKHLGYRDSFHLLSFAEKPSFEISRVLRDRESVEDVLAHLMMIQAVNKYTDIVSALGFMTDYISELPLHTVKHVLIFSDDIHEPGQEGEYTDPVDNIRRVTAISEYVRRNGWKINIVLIPELPETEVTSAEEDKTFVQRGLLAELAHQLGIKAVLLNDGTGISELDLPEGNVPASADEAVAAEDSSPLDTGSGNLGSEGSGEESGFKIERIYIFIFILLLLFILIFLFIRRLFASSGKEKTLVQGVRKGDKDSSTSAADAKILSEAAASRTSFSGFEKAEDRPVTKDSGRGKAPSGGDSLLSAFASRDREREINFTAGFARRTPVPGGGTERKNSPYKKSPLQAKPGQTAIEMKVDFQKNRLGQNIQWFDTVTSFSVGQPGVSDFEIHSIDVSGVIGTISRKEDIYTFHIDQTEYFPDLKATRIENCLGRTIRIVSPDTGYTTSIVFKPWISTLERLNRLLHMTEKPGTPGPDIEL